ncbi:hypothetical protein [Nocardia wallacei]|uniref:Uncharacterized protein n=1 Tax=Nocardia wallacei TaxID=480035 RepID=A0A7G1KJH8_9NOCA|nr:hypothetical protein [Nocardia wallacei]BCK55385.1 hypothetical protein NWFMUON74_31570 [Nocardia wallacei]
MTGRVHGADYWSVPIPRREDRAERRPAPAWTPGWLLLDLPTALLLAVFVGTGWLGYAQPGPAEADAPTPTMVIPAEPRLTPP